MPTYDYRCEKCGFEFEKFHNITETPEFKCPSCGGTTKRLISGGNGVIFKGSGFYETDYKKKSCCSNDEKCDSPKKCCEK